MNRTAFRRLLGYVPSQRWKKWSVGACGLFDAVSFALIILILGLFGQLLLNPEGGLARFGREPDVPAYKSYLADAIARLPVLHERFGCAIALLGAIVGLSALRFLLQYLLNRSSSTLVVRVATKIRDSIYRQTYRLGTTEVSGIGRAPAVDLFTQETESVLTGILAWYRSSIREPVLIVLLMTMAIMAHWALALLFLVLAAMALFLTVRVVRYAQARSRQATEKAAAGLALSQESLAMIRLTRGYLMESFEQPRFARNLEEFGQAEARQLRSTAAVRPLIGLLTVISVTFVLGLASLNLLQSGIEAFDIVTLYACLIALYWPVTRVWSRYKMVSKAGWAAQAIFDFLDEATRLGEIAGAAFLSPMTKSLQYRNVTLSEGQTEILKDINLQFPAGSRTALMGLDEKTKRALVYLIPRFVDPTDGELTIDDQDIRLVTLESLRAQVAIVMQENLVFSDTVANNIGCGEQGYGLPHIVDAAKIAHAHNFIHRLPDGYDTIIGDQGRMLTIGQQFRIALARAILRDPTVVIVEEPRAALDEDTKQLLDDTLSRFARGRTIIFLPHRLSTIRSCDNIVILHNGKVEAVGNHRELTLQSELYRHLQYTEFNDFTAV